MESTNRSWILIAGMAGLLVIGLVVKHSFRSDEEERQQTAAGKRMAELAAVAENDRGGWRTREGAEDVSASGGEGAGGAKGNLRGSGGVAGANAGGEGGGGRASGAALLRDKLRAGGRAGVGAGARLGESGSIEIASIAPSSGLPGDTRSARHAAAAGLNPAAATSDVVPATADGSTEESKADPDNPVYSLPLEGTTQPEKGENNPPVAEGVTFDNGEGAIFSVDSQVQIPNAANMNGKSGTISFWLQPEWQGADNSDAYLLQLRTPHVWENRMEIGKNAENLRVLFFPDTGQETGIGVPIKDWQPNDWHHIATSWGPDSDGVNMLSLYVDGRLIDSKPYEGDLQVPQQPLVIGNSTERDTGARGAISSFQVYNTNLQQDRISSLVAKHP